MKSSLLSRMYALTLSLLGFGVVSCENQGGGGMSMYGTPQGTFEFKAKVVDQANAPLEGVQVLPTDARYGLFHQPEFSNPCYFKTDAAGCVADKMGVIRNDSVFFFLHDPASRFADTLCAYKVQPSECSGEGKGGWRWGKVTKSIEIKVNTSKKRAVHSASAFDCVGD